MTDETLKTIAQTFGTPTYVYDLDRVAAQYRLFCQAFDRQELHVCYAMKANYNRDILLTLQGLGAGIDAVSPGDMAMALSCGFRPRDIIYTANNITDQEMDAVRAQGVLMNLDTLSLMEQKNGACIFLDRGCRIHPIKPRQCRAFPLGWNFSDFNRICGWATQQKKGAQART